MDYPYAKILHKTGLISLARKVFASRGRFVLIFHGIISRLRAEMTAMSQAGLTADKFEHILNWISRRFDFISCEDLIHSDKPGVLLTFDDGKANNYTNALPLLEKYGAPAVFFIATQHVLEPRNWLPFTRRCAQTQWDDFEKVPDRIAWDLYNGMTSKEVTLCGKHPLITIGSHTISHPFLTQLSDGELRYELLESKRQLEEMTDKTVESFAYPTNDYDERVIKAVMEAGYKFAFAVKPHKLGYPRYEIPRIEIGFEYDHYLEAKLSGLHRRPISGKIADE